MTADIGVAMGITGTDVSKEAAAVASSVLWLRELSNIIARAPAKGD